MYTKKEKLLQKVCSQRRYLIMRINEYTWLVHDCAEMYGMKIRYKYAREVKNYVEYFDYNKKYYLYTMWRDTAVKGKIITPSLQIRNYKIESDYGNVYMNLTFEEIVCWIERIQGNKIPEGEYNRLVDFTKKVIESK